ncbi:hypothetical protein D3C77_670890 [compost metagenome]
MAHIAAAHKVSNSAKNGTLAPFSLPIRASPPAATRSPSTLAARSRSPRKIAAKNRVKKACDCNTSEARPGGMPLPIASKRKAN